MTTAAERSLDQLQHLQVDETSDELLTALVTALHVGLEKPSRVAFGTDEAPQTYRALTDPRYAALEDLPYAAQWTGGKMPPRYPGETDDAYLARARLEVIHPRGMRRGTAPALKIVAQPFLTGTQYVAISDWLDDNPYKILVHVRPSECGDPDALLKALNDNEVCPGGSKVYLVVSESPAWDDDEIDGATWDDATQTWDDLTTEGWNP